MKLSISNSHIKRLLSLLLVSILIMGVAGCKKSGKTEDNSSEVYSSKDTPDDDSDVIKNESDTESTDSVVSQENPSSSTGSHVDYIQTTGSKQEQLFGNLEGTTLRVSVGPTIPNWQKEFLIQFKKKYKFKEIITVPYSYAEEQTKLPNIILSKDKKNYLDVCTTGTTTLLRYVYGNILTPIDKYIDRNDSQWGYYGKESLFAPDLYKVNGKVYGCPSKGFHEQYIFYNKTYFQERGIKDPYTEYYLKNNWNFDTFKEVAKKATKYASDGKTVDVYGFATWNYFSFLQAAGNTAIKQNTKGKWEPCISEPSGMAALNLLYDCKYENILAPFTGYTEFVQRKTAMLLERPGNAMGGNDCYNRMSDKIGMVPMPKLNNSSPYYAPICPDGMGVPVCAQNVAGAVAYIYEYNKAMEIRDKNDLQLRRKVISDEHLQIRNEYLKKAELTNTYIDGLSQWYTDNRGRFLDIMFVEKTKPANALDKMLPLIKDSIKKTTG